MTPEERAELKTKAKHLGYWANHLERMAPSVYRQNPLPSEESISRLLELADQHIRRGHDLAAETYRIQERADQYREEIQRLQDRLDGLTPKCPRSFTA